MDSNQDNRDSSLNEDASIVDRLGKMLPGSSSGPEEEDDDGMLRMSFLDHLEELRSRLIRSLLGLLVAFGAAFYFREELWAIVRRPADVALANGGGELITLGASEGFSTMWVKVPLLFGLFLASPWLLYQVWAFISPGLYKHERRWAIPFVFSTAGLFICGGLFAYFIALPFGLTFLLEISIKAGVTPNLPIGDYVDMLVNILLGLGLVFELPVLIFFLSLLRIVTPQFLLNNSRYAILIITVLAAVVTPTPDVVNLMLVAGPMMLLYFLGVFASYLLWLSREKKRFPWMLVLLILICVALFAGGIGTWLAVSKYGYHLISRFPFLVK